MAELCMKDGGTCRGAGGSMHIYVRKRALYRPHLFYTDIMSLITHRINSQGFKAAGHWSQNNSLMVRVLPKAFF
jgi:hypothetical protein